MTTNPLALVSDPVAVFPTDGAFPDPYAAIPPDLLAPENPPTADGYDPVFERIIRTERGAAMWADRLAKPDDREPEALQLAFVDEYMKMARAIAEDRAAAIEDLPAEYRREPHPLDVNDVGKAAWVMNRMRAYEDGVARAKAEAEKFIKAAEKERDSFKRAFTPGLKAWAESNLGRGTQTAKTPAGKLSFKNKGADVKCQDHAAFLQWAIVHKPDWVREVPAHKEIIELPGIKKAILATGSTDEDSGEVIAPELPPGFVYEPPIQTFHIEGVK